MQTAQELYKKMLDEFVAPAMKSAGYKRTRNTWARRSAAGWVLYQAQASWYSSKDEVNFTFNLAAHSRAVAARLREPFREDRAPPEPECHYRERIGYLMPNPQDSWWEIEADLGPFDVRRLSRGPRREPREIGEEVRRVTVDLALPHLERLGTDAGLLSCIEERDPEAALRHVWGALVREVRGEEAFDAWCAERMAGVKSASQREFLERQLRRIQ